MPLIRPDSPRAIFRRSPLSSVVVQVQFDPILGLRESAFVSPFQEEIRDRYPITAQAIGVELVLRSEGFETKEAPAADWRFSSADQDWTVIVGVNHLTVETRRYTQYEELRARFLDALALFVARFRPGARRRLGIRYVNRLHFEDGESVSAWRSLVRPELLGIAATPELVADEHVFHSIGQARFAEDEGQLVVRYGYVEPGLVPDATVEPLQSPHFLLDLDHFDLRTFPELNVEQIPAELDTFHEAIHRVFRWSLTEEAARRLELDESAELRAEVEIG